MQLSDRDINRARNDHELGIEPFHFAKEVEHGVSYGLSVASYDFRLQRIIHPEFPESKFHDCYLEPGEFRLGITLEEFRLPLGLAGRIADKSTWARRGLSLFNTFIDPGFHGHITLELRNLGNKTLEIPSGVGIGQIIFTQMLSQPWVGYSGKYQGAGADPQPAIMEKS